MISSKFKSNTNFNKLILLSLVATHANFGLLNKFFFFLNTWFNPNSFMRDATSTTILQHFYNKSWVVSYYWFKFEFSTEITFLTQQ